MSKGQLRGERLVETKRKRPNAKQRQRLRAREAERVRPKVHDEVAVRAELRAALLRPAPVPSRLPMDAHAVKRIAKLLPHLTYFDARILTSEVNALRESRQIEGASAFNTTAARAVIDKGLEGVLAARLQEGYAEFRAGKVQVWKAIAGAKGAAASRDAHVNAARGRRVPAKITELLASGVPNHKVAAKAAKALNLDESYVRKIARTSATRANRNGT